MFKKAVLVFSSVFFNIAVCEGETAVDSSADHQLRLGLAGIGVTSIYLRGDTKFKLLPAIDYKYKQFYFQGGDLGIHFFKNENWELDVGLRAYFAGDIDRGDSPLLMDMPDLSLPVSAFVSGQYKTPIGLFKLAYDSEINNKSNGETITFSYTLAFPVGKWFVVPTVSAIHISDEVTNYFYGVAEDYAMPSRPYYLPGSSMAYRVGILGLYEINDKFSIVGNVSHNLFGSEIADSPIVEKDNSNSFFIGFLHKIF